jgi:hypothetical protein
MPFAARNLPKYEFEVDYSCQPTASPLHSYDATSAAMHLRGGTLSREGCGRTEFSLASAVAFAPCARLSGRSTPTARDAALRPPLQPSVPDPMLRQRREGRACARAPRGRPPKLSRSVEVNSW